MAFRIFKLFRNNKEVGVLKDKNDTSSNALPSDGIRFTEHDQYNSNNPTIKFYKDAMPDGSWTYESSSVEFNTNLEHALISEQSSLKNKIMTLMSHSSNSESRRAKFQTYINDFRGNDKSNAFAYLNSNRGKNTQY